MKIILHVGMGKTGTSSLQRVLRKNQTRLSSAGVTYPDFFGENAHAGFALLCLSKNEWPFPRAYRHFSDFECLEKAREIRRVLDVEINNSSNVSLFSSEYLFYYSELAQIKLKGLLCNYSSDIDVVAWIRHPVQYYFSLMRQRSKTIGMVKGRSKIPPEELPLNLRHKVERLSRVWPSVTLYPYELEHMRGHDIVPDFFSKVLSPYVSFTPKSVQQNVSLDNGGFEAEDLSGIYSRAVMSFADDIKFYEQLFRRVNH